MSEIAVRVVEPGGERTAQLLDDRAPVRELVAVLVVRLELPERPTYRLIDESTRQVLGADETLGALGVTHGDVLRLDVVRDRVLDLVLEELYRQAKRQARKKLWQLVREKLQTIRRLDPEYPDPDGLEGLADAALGRAGQRQGRSRPRRVESAPVPPAPPPAPPPVPPPVPETPPAPSGAAETTGTAGCLKAVIVLVAIGAVVHYWDDIRTWGEGLLAGTAVDGRISAGSGGRIDVVDHNTVLDFAYGLYLNDRYVGDVRNAPGGTTSYDVTFRKGRNVVELRFLDDNRATDTRLQIRINQDQFTKEFLDTGEGERQSFRWVLDGS